MQETRLKIKLFGNPALRKKSKPVKEITQEHRDILAQMARLLYADSGSIGLAAPQVGINKAMVIVDIGTGLYKLINPRIIRKEGQQVNNEGCLSLPGICIKVRRAKKVTVRAQDENGTVITIDAEDLLACVFQHEIDHLRGRLIVDYASLLEKVKIRKKLEGLKRKDKDEGMPESETKLCQLQL
ncbi:MAG: peptide deformylase [Candidatus Omnitrophota bacterium]